MVDIVLGFLSSGGGRADRPLGEYINQTLKMKRRPFSEKVGWDGSCCLGNRIIFFLYIRYETIRVRTISWWISQLQLFTTMFGEVLQVTFTSPPCNSSIVAFSSNVKQKTSQFINYTEESRIYLPYSPRPPLFPRLFPGSRVLHSRSYFVPLEDPFSGACTTAYSPGSGRMLNARYCCP